jgi:hypothetical protein
MKSLFKPCHLRSASKGGEVLSYTQRNTAQDQQEACQKARAITAICQQLSLPPDPINWQKDGMWAKVSVKEIPIAPLLDFGEPRADDILRLVRMKLLEHAALQAAHAGPETKASIWSPVAVVQPQPFLSFWVITLETHERIPIVEVIRGGQRIYEPYPFDRDDAEQTVSLFGPPSQGDHHPGETITIKEHDYHYTGEVLYVIPAGKAANSRKPGAGGSHTFTRTAPLNEVAAKYLVDCNDGFPHLVSSSQVIR